MRHIGPIKVLIVDDSPLVRSILSRELSSHEGISVIGGAKDPYEARELIIQFRPDVIVLDIEMPRMDGLTFLRKLRVHYPVPVIMCSGVAPASSRAALEAIESGAVDVVAKPTTGGRDAMRRLGEELADKIRAAAIAMSHRPAIPASASAKPSSFRKAGLDPSRYLIALGASTGGTEAIHKFLQHVPADFPPIAIVQHMPEGFTASFAGRLDQLSLPRVSEAADGDVLRPGQALLARGGIQMSVRLVAQTRRISLGTRELVNRHCPSVDVLFDSVASVVGRQAVGVLLTGMGADGARGLLKMRQAGALTFAQNRESCVVYGMPKEAVENGAAQATAPPQRIPQLIVEKLRDQQQGTGRKRPATATQL